MQLLSEEGFSVWYQRLVSDVKVLDLQSVVTEEFKAVVCGNADVALWLSKIGFSTKPHYVTSICYFLKCVGIEDPSVLLDLKVHEDVKRRFFPAEKLAEVWITKAKEQGVSAARIKKTLDALRSFFKHNRVPLIEVKCTYKPKMKGELTDEQLRRFREGFNWYGKILFDFMVSVPLRDGQFQICPNCGADFHPKWRHITTYPRIEAYSPFVIKPQKGHESNMYPEGLRQVCYLTETAAQDLNSYRDLKEKLLNRKLSPNEYIFTHQKNLKGQKHITPITKMTVVFFFQEAQERIGVKLSPHTLRSWVNSILASRGIDKQLRDLYLGHSCAYEEGYIMQLLPKWQHTFKQAKAMEHLDIIGGFVSTFDIEDKLMQIEEQEKEIERLRNELKARTINEEDMETLKLLLEMMKEGKIKIQE